MIAETFFTQHESQQRVRDVVITKYQTSEYFRNSTNRLLMFPTVLTPNLPQPGKELHWTEIRTIMTRKGRWRVPDEAEALVRVPAVISFTQHQSNNLSP